MKDPGSKIFRPAVRPHIQKFSAEERVVTSVAQGTLDKSGNRVHTSVVGRGHLRSEGAQWGCLQRNARCSRTTGRH